MDNFKAVNKILTALEKAMDLPEIGIAEIMRKKNRPQFSTLIFRGGECSG